MTKENKSFEPFSTLPDSTWLSLFELLQQNHLTIEQWQPEIAQQIYEQLEHPNWAPWLEASSTTIAERALVFPEGQLLIKDQGLLVASLSMNRINWDGEAKNLPTWDQVAGLQTTNYSETYIPSGNTLVMMSMNVAPDSKGKQLPSKMLEYVKLLAQDMGIEHIIGSFRPSGFGQYKLNLLSQKVADTNPEAEILSHFPNISEYHYKKCQSKSLFWEYCNMKTPGTDKPLDPWLRSLWWAGMRIIQEDPNAMSIQTSLDTFLTYNESYQPEYWKCTRVAQSGIQRWECGEVGEWEVDPGYGSHQQFAKYKESNVWGIIPFK